jgi:hypothetical protein
MHKMVRNGIDTAQRSNLESLDIKSLAHYSLRNDGFIAFNGHDGKSVSDDGSFEQLVDAFAHLPPDPYNKGLGRFRRYSRAVILPWMRHLSWMPPCERSIEEPQSEYDQGSHNPEYLGVRRTFPALAAELCANRLLNALIWQDYDLTFWSARDLRLPVHVGVHMMKLMVTEPGSRAISSPNMLHQDGEPFTFVHLIGRKNVIGGVNVIAPPMYTGLHPEELHPQAITARFELVQPLESYGVHDPQVSHYVGAVHQLDLSRPAERSVLLIDFAVMAVVL